jgi:hypothetical protein
VSKRTETKTVYVCDLCGAEIERDAYRNSDWLVFITSDDNSKRGDFCCFEHYNLWCERENAERKRKALTLGDVLPLDTLLGEMVWLSDAAREGRARFMTEYAKYVCGNAAEEAEEECMAAPDAPIAMHEDTEVTLDPDASAEVLYHGVHIVVSGPFSAVKRVVDECRKE